MQPLGLTDVPATKDEFDIDLYRDSMVQFIEYCKTPMTISIQGTWGTGKTSFMKMVAGDLKNCKYIEFNTWQFSQFEMDSRLPINLIRSLIEDMGLDDKEKSGILHALGGATKLFLPSLIEKHTHIGNLGGAVKEVVEKLESALTDNEDNPIADVKDIKSKFQECVKKCKDKSKKNRLVIFIDDLDRLEPRKAVELLEVLKNFLDCEDCVFILAIDYDVVCRGVAAKYGDANNGGTLDKKKGKDFFDKIIQVPFKMPVAQYNTEKYLTTCLKGITENDQKLFSDADDYKQYYRLVLESVGSNPRAIKRLTNSFQLLVLVVQMHKKLDIRKCKLVVFATLCLQELDTDVYNAIVRDRLTLTEEKLLAFAEKDPGKIAQFYPSLHIDEDDEESIDLDRISVFMRDLIGIIDTDEHKGISQEELDAFIDVLDLTSITSTDDNEGQKKGKRGADVYQDDLSKARLKQNNLDDLEKIVGFIKGCLESPDGDRITTFTRVQSQSERTVIEIKYEGERAAISLFERIGGFSLEILNDTAYFQTLPEGAANFIAENKNKINESTRPGMQYYNLTAKNGNEKDLAIAKLFADRFREYHYERKEA